MQKEICVAFFIFGATLALPPGSSKQYRDYEYNRKTDAFYKLHIEETFNSRAKSMCSIEGAMLMIPSSNDDVVQLHGMMKRYPDIGDLVYIGDDGQKHDSAEEAPIIDLTPSSPSSSGSGECDVMTRRGEIETTGCYRRHPFICKVEAKDAPYDDKCGVYANDYKYYDNVKSCYKVPPSALTWNAAYSACHSEGSHLAILNSEAESQTVKEFLKTAPRSVEAKTNYFFFVGIRADRPTSGSQRVFRTILNETLPQAGFDVWSDGEPNNHDDSEYCGTIFSNNGKYNDVDCTDSYGFICEKEVASK